MKYTDRESDNWRFIIVKNAAEDYLHYMWRRYWCLKCYDEGRYDSIRYKRRLLSEIEDLTEQIEDLIAWFHGEYYSIICDIDGDYMIEQLNKQFKEMI